MHMCILKADHFCPKEFVVLALEGHWVSTQSSVMYSDRKVYYNEIIPADILSCEYSPV